MGKHTKQSIKSNSSLSKRKQHVSSTTHTPAHSRATRSMSQENSQSKQVTASKKIPLSQESADSKKDSKKEQHSNSQTNEATKSSESNNSNESSESSFESLSSLLSDSQAPQPTQMLAQYQITSRDMQLQVKIYRVKDGFTPIYDVYVPSIGEHTRLILEKIRQQLVKEVQIDTLALSSTTHAQVVTDAFTKTIVRLIKQYFPTAPKEHIDFFVSFLALRSIGLGEVDILMSDSQLEEIAINGAKQPVRVYHRQYGWLTTNIYLESEEQIKHYSATIGRKVGRQISVLEPLLDVTINVGDRVNATLMPISNEGNTITIRKFSAKPWTITDLLSHNTLSVSAAALLWHCMQFELSALVAGGTASGKTSMLNSLSNFIPPDQRILTIEDTREIKLPDFMHCIPMLTRLSNAEGRGGVTMLHLLQNSLRMRPDRILVGEIRRPQEAEVLFEAIHTGHSVYATIHANTANECVSRLVNAPMNIPQTMLPALSLIIVQYRNRRSGKRRTFEIAEITPKGESRVLFSYDPIKDQLKEVAQPLTLFETLQTFTGESIASIKKELAVKEEILQLLVKHSINTNEQVAKYMAQYYHKPADCLAQLRTYKPVQEGQKTHQ
jgi:archaeal flagellar protein FlaI